MPGLASATDDSSLPSEPELETDTDSFGELTTGGFDVVGDVDELEIDADVVDSPSSPTISSSRQSSFFVWVTGFFA